MRPATSLAALGLVLVMFVAGCHEDVLLGPHGGSAARYGNSDTPQNGDVPPPGLATVSLGAEELRLWPYTGSSFDGTPVDPVNLIFAGDVHPVQIRAALMALDGDRSAFGIPPVPPFDARWTDVVGGGVQTAYTEGPIGWTGSMIQLTLGDFGPIRVHLRLFTTGRGYGETGTWTVGAAHFELQIPGTADHQVLSWELAEQIVVADLVRSGLLDADVPMQPSGPISQAPSYRTIPAILYNGLPIEAGTWHRSAAVVYNQVVPKPFCSDGPGDFVLVTGPVDFTTQVTVSPQGRYDYLASYAGELVVTPVDMSSGVPVPVGDPVAAEVDGRHDAHLTSSEERVVARDRRLIQGGDGTEMWRTRLMIQKNGRKSYTLDERCLD